MGEPRYKLGLLCLASSLVSLLLVCTLSLLDRQAWLVAEDACLPAHCTLHLHGRCLHCAHRHHTVSEVMVRYRRAASGYEEKCYQVAGCLHSCADAEDLVSFCEEDEQEEGEEVGGDCEEAGRVVLGQAGGDWQAWCEHTVESTVAAVRAGVTGIHIDLSVSEDGEVFLWRDQDPTSLSARLRQLGVWGVGRCWPALALSTRLPAHNLTWADIQSSWGWAGPGGQHVPLLRYKDWLAGVAGLGLSRIWLEFRCPAHLLRPTLSTVWRLTGEHGMQDRLYFSMDGAGRLQLHQPRLSWLAGLSLDLGPMSSVQRGEVGLLVVAGAQLVRDREDEALLRLLRGEPGPDSSSIADQVEQHGYAATEEAGLAAAARELLHRGGRCPATQLAVSGVNSWEGMASLACLQINTWVTNSAPLLELVDLLTKCQQPGKPVPILAPSPGPDCPPFCPRILAPVCGTDNQTYSNACTLQQTACEDGLDTVVLHEGDCSRPY